MSTRPLLVPQAVMSNADLSADAYSLVTNTNRFSILSYNIIWTGTPTGSFQVEVCNDYIPSPKGVLDPPTNAGTWVALTLSTVVSATGSSGSAFIDIDLMGAAWMRLHYVSVSGAGNATATIAGKVS